MTTKSKTKAKAKPKKAGRNYVNGVGPNCSRCKKPGHYAPTCGR